MGVGGTRKAQFAKYLKSKIPRSSVMKGSAILFQEVFGFAQDKTAQMDPKLKDVYYKSLSEMRPDRKKYMYNTGIETIFKSLDKDETLIIDTHLMMPIYFMEVLTHIENMWDNDFIPYLTSIAYLKDTPKNLSKRRAQEQHDLSWIRYPWKLDMVKEDQDVNFVMLNGVIKDVSKFGIRTAILDDDDLIDDFCWKYLAGEKND